MWFVFAVAAAFAWGAEEVFLKGGTDENDRLSHHRLTACRGFIMGLAGICLLPFSESGLPLPQLLSANKLFLLIPTMYAVSLMLANNTYRYLDASVNAPIQGASGAFPPVILVIWYFFAGKIGSIWDEVSVMDLVATAVIIGASIGLAVIQQKLADGDMKTESGKSVKLGALAFIFPVIFCLADATDTVLCGVMLDDQIGKGLGSFDYLILYMFTFAAIGLISWLRLMYAEKKPYNLFKKSEWKKNAGGLMETIAQSVYVFGMAEKPTLVAPVIASYPIISVFLSRIVLKEKLLSGQYACIAVVLAGILMLGVSEGLKNRDEEHGSSTAVVQVYNPAEYRNSDSLCMTELPSSVSYSTAEF